MPYIVNVTTYIILYHIVLYIFYLCIAYTQLYSYTVISTTKCGIRFAIYCCSSIYTYDVIIIIANDIAFHPLCPELWSNLFDFTMNLLQEKAEKHQEE